MKHVLFTIKDIDGWRRHCAFLVENELIAKDTMSFENCVYERSVVFERQGDWYMVGTVNHQGEQKPADMNIELNQIHKEAREKYLGYGIAKFEGDFVFPQNAETLYEFVL